MIVHGWCVPFLTQDHIYQKCGFYNTHIWRNGISSNICWNLKLTTISHKNHITIYLYMDVSKNRSTQHKHGFSYLNWSFCGVWGYHHLRKHPYCLQIINQTKKTTRKLPNHLTTSWDLTSRVELPMLHASERWNLWNLRKKLPTWEKQKKTKKHHF